MHCEPQSVAMLADGARVPEFALPGVHHDETDSYRLSQYTDDDKWVLLAFYSFDFHPICTAGTCALRDTEFLQFEDDLQVLGVSGDSSYAHEEYADRHRFNYPLLSDTGRTVGRKYDVVVDTEERMEDVHQRSVVLIDPSRTVRLTASIDVDRPQDLEVGPLLEAIRAVRPDPRSISSPD